MSQSERKNILKRFAGDMIYSLVSLMVLNMVLSFGVYPFLRTQLGTDGSGRMLFYTAIMGMVAASVGSGINYGRMKASTRHKTENGDYNVYLLVLAALSAAVTIVGYLVKKDTAGESVFSIAVLIFATAVRYYGDVEYRLTLNYKGFFWYYIIISAGYGLGIFMYRYTGSWVSIFLMGELAGLVYVTIRGHIFRRPLFRRSVYFKEDASTCASLSSAYLMSEFVTYTDRMVLPVLAGNTASYYFFIASTVGKMSSLISTPLNGVITGHLSRYEGKITKKMFTTVLLALLILAVVLTAGTTLGSHIYVYLFYREDYEAVKSLFLWASVGQVFFFMSNTMMTVVLRFAPEKYQMIMGAVYAVLFFVCVLPAMWFFKIWGAVWGLLGINVVKFLVITLLGYLALQKKQKEK